MARRITDSVELMARARKMLPTGIPAEAIIGADYESGNGYWVYLDNGYICPSMECHTIHEDTLKALAYMVGTVEVWADDPAFDMDRKRAEQAQTQETTQNKEDQTMNNNFSDIVVKDGYRLIAYVERGSLADAIIYRESVSDYVVCLYYDRTDGTWGQGRYTGKNKDEAYRILADRIKPDSDYDYRAAIIEDVREYINNISLSEYADKDEAREALYDDMWCADDVTGNGSGSYWFDAYKAEEALMHNLDLLGEAVEEFGGDMDILSKGAEACDVTIRCYLLGEALDTVLDEIDEPTAWKEA